MDLNKFTIKSQEALQGAQTKAINLGHQEVDGEHFLLAMAEQTDGLFPRLLQRLEISVDSFRGRLQQELEKKPRISGPGIEPGKVYSLKNRWAVRFHYQGIKDKPQTLVISFDKPWGQSSFVGLLQEMGFQIIEAPLR